MSAGTVGDCGSSRCHSECGDASGCYGFLQNQGYLDGTTNPPLIQNGQSCLTIYSGGNMPKSGKTSAQWKTDLEAWAKAGAQNN